MLCTICKEKPATVHLTQIVGDKMQKLDLCEDCAKAKGINDPTGFSLADADVLFGLGASQEIEQAVGAGIEVLVLRFFAGGFQEVRPARLPGMLQDVCRRIGRPAQDDAQGHAARRQGAGGAARVARKFRPAEDAPEKAGEGD